MVTTILSPYNIAILKSHLFRFGNWSSLDLSQNSDSPFPWGKWTLNSLDLNAPGVWFLVPLHQTAAEAPFSEITDSGKRTSQVTMTQIVVHLQGNESSPNHLGMTTSDEKENLEFRDSCNAINRTEDKQRELYGRSLLIYKWCLIYDAIYKELRRLRVLLWSFICETDYVQFHLLRRISITHPHAFPLLLSSFLLLFCIHKSASFTYLIHAWRDIIWRTRVIRATSQDASWERSLAVFTSQDPLRCDRPLVQSQPLAQSLMALRKQDVAEELKETNQAASDWGNSFKRPSLVDSRRARKVAKV